MPSSFGSALFPEESTEDRDENLGLPISFRFLPPSHLLGNVYEVLQIFQSFEKKIKFKRAMTKSPIKYNTLTLVNVLTKVFVGSAGSLFFHFGQNVISTMSASLNDEGCWS